MLPFFLDVVRAWYHDRSSTSQYHFKPSKIGQLPARVCAVILGFVLGCLLRCLRVPGLSRRLASQQASAWRSYDGWPPELGRLTELLNRWHEDCLQADSFAEIAWFDVSWALKRRSDRSGHICWLTGQLRTISSRRPLQLVSASKCQLVQRRSRIAAAIGAERQKVLIADGLFIYLQLSKPCFL